MFSSQVADRWLEGRERGRRCRVAGHRRLERSQAVGVLEADGAAVMVADLLAAAMDDRGAAGGEGGQRCCCRRRR